MDLRHLASAAMTIGLSVVIIVVIAMILNAFSEQICLDDNGTWTSGACSVTGTAYNISQKGLSGMETFGNWIPMLVIAVVASIVVGILFSYFIMGIGGEGRRTRG